MSTKQELKTKGPSCSLKAYLQPMNGTYQKYSSSIASTTIATQWDSVGENQAINDDCNSECWEGDFNESFSPADAGEATVPEELEDFSCSVHSIDFNDLLPQEDDLNSFHSSYSLGKSLGEGAFGVVHQCSARFALDEGKDNSFAVKTVPMHRYNHDEIEILDQLRECPTITQVKDVFYEDDAAFIIMEEMEGGELLDRIGEKECYSELEAKILFKTLLQTVQYCHCNGIAHCDIKPENILLRYKDDDTNIQLADFGLAKRFIDHKGQRKQLFEMNGSAEYAAPEVFNRPDGDVRGYDERCDIWSLGVILYILLAGYAPFDANTPMETIMKVARGDIKFHRRYWKNISVEAKILIVQLLQVDPDERCSIEEALQSPWFGDIADED